MASAKPPFRLDKIGQVARYVGGIERSRLFYTDVLGFEVSDFHNEDLMPGGALSWPSAVQGDGG